LLCPAVKVEPFPAGHSDRNTGLDAGPLCEELTVRFSYARSSAMNIPREIGATGKPSAAQAKIDMRIFADTAELSRAAANEFSRLARHAVATRERFTVALAGGATPRGAYTLLADEGKRASLPWEKIHVFFGDERPVPPEHCESNYGMAWDALLSHLPIPADNVHRIRGELNAQAAADQYEAELRRHFQLQVGQMPRFDLVMLGMGGDGHTASLFPESPALNETSRLVIANWVDEVQQYRLTVTFPVLNNAREIMFLVAGSAKAEVIGNLFNEHMRSTRYPVQKVKPVDGRVLWLLDRAAAQALHWS
jgi:6-phosphogluconolactonase